MTVELAVAQFVFTVVSSVVTATQASSAAKRREQLERERLAIETQQRQLNEARALATARRQQRAKQAQIRSQAAAQGVIFSSGLEGAEQASRSNLVREEQFAAAQSGLSSRLDANASSIIAERSSSAQSDAFAGAVKGIGGALFTGLGDLAKAGEFSPGGFFDTTTMETELG